MFTRSRTSAFSAAVLTVALLAFGGFGCSSGQPAETAPAPAAQPLVRPPEGPPPGTATEDAVAAQPVPPVSGCLNEYFPIRVGQSVTYILNGGPQTVKMAVRSSSDGHIALEFTDAKGKPVLSWKVVCGPDGSIVPESYFDPDGLAGPIISEEIQTVRGFYLPPAMSVGSSWSVSYDLISRSAGTGAKSTAPDQISHIQYRNRAQGQEQISVPAGGYTALHITSQITAVDEAPGTSQLLPVTSKTRNEWWVKGIGLVRLEEEGSGFSLTATAVGK